MERMQDLDPVETGEWVDSLRAVLHHQGSARATYLLERLAEEAGRTGIAQPSTSLGTEIPSGLLAIAVLVLLWTGEATRYFRGLAPDEPTS